MDKRKKEGRVGCVCVGGGEEYFMNSLSRLLYEVPCRPAGAEDCFLSRPDPTVQNNIHWRDWGLFDPGMNKKWREWGGKRKKEREKNEVEKMIRGEGGIIVREEII